MKKILFITLAAIWMISATSSTAKLHSRTEKANVADTVAILAEKAEKGDAVAQNTFGLWYYTGKNVKQDFRTAFTWWSKSAKQQNADAIGNMAMCLQLGKGTKKDTITALKMYKIAIKKGNNGIVPQHEAIVKNTKDMFSCRLLYDCYSNGIGVKRDAKKAEAYLRILSEGGDVESQFNLALKCLNSKRPQEAAKLFKAAAVKGYVAAIYYYGFLTFSGMGTKQDKTNGIKLMQIAADKGFKAAHYQLGKIFYNGDGTAKDIDKAIEFLGEATNENKDAAWLLAMCHLETTPPDLFLAVQWMAEAVKTHEKDFNKLMATNEGDGVYDYILGLRKYYVDKDYEAAIKMFKNVAKVSPEGYTMHAVCLANKNYGKRNLKKAIKTLEKAVKEGSVAAKYYLASIYRQEGKNKQAMELLKAAADGGIAFAQCRLGDMLFTGDGVVRDYVKAASYYLMAEKQNYLTPESAQNLITCYERGISSLPDVENYKQRITELRKITPNNNLTNMLRAIKE